MTINTNMHRLRHLDSQKGADIEQLKTRGQIGVRLLEKPRINLKGVLVPKQKLTSISKPAHLSSNPDNARKISLTRTTRGDSITSQTISILKHHKL